MSCFSFRNSAETPVMGTIVLVGQACCPIKNVSPLLVSKDRNRGRLYITKPSLRPKTEKPSYRSAVARLNVWWSGFRRSRVFSSELNRFLCPCRTKVQSGTLVAEPRRYCIPRKF